MSAFSGICSERKIQNTELEISDYTIEVIRNYLEDKEIMVQTPPNVFSYIIRNKQLPKNANRVLWLKKYVDGTNLINFFNLSVDDFNNCFVCQQGKELNEKNHKITATSGYTDFYYFLEELKY